MAQPLAPKGGNDKVMTPESLAAQITSHFSPTGSIIEPCRGKGAFFDAFCLQPEITKIDWCEIDEGRDFLTYDFEGKHFNWTITNPPWSQIRPFLKRAMELSDNIVFLCLVNAFFMKARLRDMKEGGFGFREVLFVDTPPKPWPQTGFQLGAVYIQRGYSGSVTFSSL